MNHPREPPSNQIRLGLQKIANALILPQHLGSRILRRKVARDRHPGNYVALFRRGGRATEGPAQLRRWKRIGERGCRIVKSRPKALILGAATLISARTPRYISAATRCRG